MAKPRKEKLPGFGLGSRVVAGCMLAVLLVGGAGGWAATASLSGAVIAQGVVAVDGEIKTIQHRDGGIVSAIAVKEGDAVTQGQVLVRLEDAQIRAELAILRVQLTELALRRARLEAERDGADSIILPAGLELTPEAAAILAGEQRLFEGQRSNRISRKSQLALTVDQISDEIRGLEAQRASTLDERALILEEHEKMKSLAEKGLIERGRLYAMERERARINGQSGEIEASIARARARISEVNLQILAIEETSRTEAQRELSTVETRFAELSERRTAVEDLLSRSEIRAPIDGIVNELHVTTIGGVISPAQVLITLVPHDARLTVEARIPAVSIDQVAPDQMARLRFTTFNHRITPELLGDVVHVSAAATRDEASGMSYFVAKVNLAAAELAKLPSDRLLPGTPVEVYVQTEERTALSYLVRPLTDQFSRALRER